MIEDHRLKLLEGLRRGRARARRGGCYGHRGRRQAHGLTARAVERDHQQTAEALAQRLLTDKRLELGDSLGVTAERELALE